MKNDHPIYLIEKDECQYDMHALITGSFDPITVGHYDVIRRAATLFKKVTVCAFVNPDKEYLLTLEEKEKLIRAACRNLHNVTVKSDSGMVYAYCKANGINVIVRGVRNDEDLSAEHAAARYNYEHSGVPTLLLGADPALATVSSSILKEKLTKGESVSDLLAQGTETLFLDMLLQRL